MKGAKGLTVDEMKKAENGRKVEEQKELVAISFNAPSVRKNGIQKRSVLL